MGVGGAASGGERPGQGSHLIDPLAVFAGPIAALDAFPPGEQLPGEPGIFEVAPVEKVEATVIRQSRITPGTVGNEHVTREVWRIWAGRKQNRLARVVGSAGKPMRNEAGRPLVP